VTRRLLAAILIGVLAALACAATSPEGWIFFESERRGNMDIYVVRPDGSELLQLTTHEAADSSPSVSPDGTTVAFSSSRDGNAELYLMNLDGSGLRRLTHTTADEYYSSWSPDGTRIVCSQAARGDVEICVVDVATGEVSQITDNDVDDWFPSWSPSGERIAFARGRFPDNCIYVMAPDGTEQIALTGCTGYHGAPKWSPDGSQIAFYQEVAAGNTEVFVMGADGSNVRRLTNQRGWDARPAWSPDGLQIVFDSDRGGQWDIWAMDADGSNPRKLTDDRHEDHCAVWCAGGGRPGRRYIGPAGSDEGWDPSLGETRTMALVAHSAEGLESVLTFDLAPDAKGTLACEPVSGFGDKLAGLCVSGKGLNAVVEDMARGLTPRVWTAPTEGAAWLVLVLSTETGKIASVLASPDEGLAGEMKAGLADGRVTLRGKFAAAHNASDMATNLVRNEASEVALDAKTGQVVLVR